MTAAPHLRSLRCWLACAPLLFAVFTASDARAGQAGSGISIAYQGMFIGDTTIAGEQKKDGLQPSHPYCWQLSRDRWFWLYQTRGFEGIDAEHSVLYQLRRDAPDGPVMTEGRLAQFRNDWDPLNDGSRHWKIHGHPKVFGVPRGARAADGRPFTNDNIFAAAWYVRGRAVAEGKLLDPKADKVLTAMQHLDWVHFRLNDRSDDIELLGSPVRLRQRGFEEGDAFCSAFPGRVRMNHWQHPAMPMDAAHTRWLDTPHFDGDGVAAIEYRFNAATRRYEWVRTGAVVRSDPNIKGRFFEGSVNRLGEEWILCIRNRGHILPGRRGECTAWFKTTRPFDDWGSVTYAETPSTYGPRTAWLMADGVLRIFSGDMAASPYRQGQSGKRDPLFCWDVNPKDFSVSTPRTILDGRKTLGMELPMIGFAKLSPVHDNRQILTFRVTTMNHQHATDTMPAVSAHDLAQSGAYYSVITFTHRVEDTWRF